MTKIITVNPKDPEEIPLADAVRVIQAGGVIAFPTETFYGLGVSAFNEKAIKKVFEIKKRSLNKPFIVLVDDESSLSELVSEIPEVAFPLIEKFWPGALTLIFKASSKLPSLITGHTGTIGVRVSSSLIARKLVKMAAIPITATSANREGDESPSLASQVAYQLGDTIDLTIDGGRTKGKAGSTIIDVTRFPPRIVRRGAVLLPEIEKITPLQ
jgi:L-threonylcarbamoyladenylate synthase